LADIVSPEKRSEMMSGISSRNTKPEIMIRKVLYQQGFRFRLHRKDLPGTPDLLFPKYNALIFVHGCFWHGHDCRLFKWPSSRPDFWKKKVKKLFEIYRETMSTPGEILEKAVSKAVPARSPASAAKKNFSKIIDQIGREAYSLFLAEQENAGKRAVRKYLEGVIPGSASRRAAIKSVSNKFGEFDRFFLSLAQSRKPRAGNTFEWIIKDLFKKLNYPFAEQQVINGKPDFLMPGREHYDTNPMDCIIFTVKTTVRERWRQIVTEGTRGLGFFLATADKKISGNQPAEMLKNRIYIVVSSEIRKRVPHYSTAPNVISFEKSFRDHLDPAVHRWKRIKII
jgi:DNA mismatch endonuclease Vsr